ncbi:MAG: hypothetical protein ITG02_00870, partial [Patulibacter sp.]|nr:hypothetical protein [Patulibacter sp.]
MTTAADASPPELLAAELAGMLRSGVTIEACRSAESLLSLSIARAKAASERPDDLAVSVNNLIREACAAVDAIDSGGIAVLLGIAPNYRGRSLKDRRIAAAAKLGYSVEHLRKDRTEPLLEAVADELYAMDSAYRLRHRHRELPPERSTLRIDWLEQHRSYRRIWTPITGLRSDLHVLLDYFRVARDAGLTPHDVDDGARHDISDRLSSMTWYLARFSTELQRFVEREGGLWLLADAEAEIQAAEAIYRIQTLLPFGEADISWVRGLLKDPRHEELEPFTDSLIAAGEIRREFMATWVDWASVLVEAEEETPSRPRQKPACVQWLDACNEFIGLIDADWYRVADWYAP